jgi:dephospho-CoA kinase
VARRFAEQGAVVIVADQLAREVVGEGTPGLAAVVREFGQEVLLPTGSLDRGRLAQIVFTDVERRTALERIIHPLVRERSQQLIDAAGEEAVVVYDVPLLAEQAGTAADRLDEFDVIVVVEAPRDVRIQRLVLRGLTAQDAEQRIAAQATDEQRRAIADVVIVNDDSLDVLNATVDDLWWELFGTDETDPDDDDLDDA